MKKILSTMLAALLCLSLLAGCGGKKETAEPDNFFKTDKEISYVMIYNPNIFDQLAFSNEDLTTGDLAAYVEAISQRADGLDDGTLPEIVPVAAKDQFLPEGIADLSGNRAEAMYAPYQVGDIRDFYTFDRTDDRVQRTFECKYAGTYCNIWTSDNYVSDSDIAEYGREFDNNVYEATISTFAEPRFVDNGLKVNLLFTELNGSTGGLAYAADCYSSSEVSPAQCDAHMVNTDHIIVNINSLMAAHQPSKQYIKSTMAHEFQHYICFSNTLLAGSEHIMRTWLNESMSGYIEEQLYSGAKDGHLQEFATSDRIRHGQSMYNFATDTTAQKFDIGVYGSVYLFSEYLANKAGDDVFGNIHNYWRTAYGTVPNEAEAIIDSAPQSMYEQIDKSIDYADALSFRTEEEEWMSKLTLDFYLSLLAYDKNDPNAFKKVEAQTLLYDEINAANIEGGGRVIAALKNGEFEVPEDADNGLVYIGLNSEFEVVTDYIIK